MHREAAFALVLVAVSLAIVGTQGAQAQVGSADGEPAEAGCERSPELRSWIWGHGCGVALEPAPGARCQAWALVPWFYNHHHGAVCLLEGGEPVAHACVAGAGSTPWTQGAVVDCEAGSGSTTSGCQADAVTNLYWTRATSRCEAAPVDGGLGCKVLMPGLFGRADCVAGGEHVGVGPSELVEVRDRVYESLSPVGSLLSSVWDAAPSPPVAA